MLELLQATRRVGLEPLRCGSTTQLEEDGYCVTYDTLKEWILITPQGKRIVFKRDTDLWNRMPCTNIREHKEGFALVQTVRKNFEGYTKREVSKRSWHAKLG